MANVFVAFVADAQELPPHRFEVAFGGGYFGGGNAGDADANLRANSTTPESYRLFGTSSAFGGAPMAEARVGVTLTRRLAIEGRVGYSRPELRTSVGSDAESAPAVTIAERIDQYVIDGGIVFQLDEVRVGGARPFVAAGAGYLRQLHEGLTLIEQGHVYHLGGGLRYPFLVRDRGRLRAAGLRVDARLYLLAGGIAVENRLRPRGAISGSLFLTF